MHDTYPRFLEEELDEITPEEALFHVIPVPLEQTVSYGGGTGKGPSAILRASSQLELYDGVSNPSEHGIWTAPPVETEGPLSDVVGRIKGVVERSFALGKLPVLLGGEHTVTVGALEACRAAFGEIGIVQIDAHADLRDTYEGTPYSHACVMRRACDMGHTVFQAGIRSLSLPEVAFRKSHPVHYLDARDIAKHGIPEQMLPDGFPERIWLTIDVDGLDASVMPATGTPEPGGITWYQCHEIIEKAVSGRRVAGFDVVELAPVKGLHFPDFTAARLVYDTMGFVSRSAIKESL
ncbi:agmatinase [Desulfoluna butyratoxydans]|uniref:Ureohydrolase n=1 Tax=Desulfoluna butyratoxydans TaxID=231438 RepID=A0A4U8YYG4_9BACT|nr:agmatinase [Desulfoluna butyratoxydans]VFQ46573.1 ureohydrolase [Desulfoluna butyratoxydans]